jgi:hypothetical protein
VLTFEIIALIISLCNFTSVEDNKSNWTELKNVEKYQIECRVWYMDCMEKKSGVSTYSPKNIKKCIKERLK